MKSDAKFRCKVQITYIRSYLDYWKNGQRNKLKSLSFPKNFNKPLQRNSYDKIDNYEG